MDIKLQETESNEPKRLYMLCLEDFESSQPGNSPLHNSCVEKDYVTNYVDTGHEREVEG